MGIAGGSCTSIVESGVAAVVPAGDEDTDSPIGATLAVIVGGGKEVIERSSVIAEMLSTWEVDSF